MLVSIAMASLAMAGVRGNMGKGLRVADAIHIQPPTIGMTPAMAGAGGGVVAGGPVFIPGSITSAGPVNIGISAMSGVGAGGSKATTGESKASKASTKTGKEATKSVNLPAWKKVNIDMDHIASGHMRGGSRVSTLKSLFPEYMGRAQVERAVRQAYRFGEKISSQGERVLVRGQYERITIEMWVNRATRTIETAYPVAF
jgi:hypothetical protein